MKIITLPRCLSMVAISLMLTACKAVPEVSGQAQRADPQALASTLLPETVTQPVPDFLLIGEVHDHPLQHGLRARWLSQLADGSRFVLAMEQFDVDQQAALDAARARGLSARGLAEAAGFAFHGWDWSLYEPYVQIAIQHGLPLRAANLSSAQTRAIARGQKTVPAGVRPADWSAQDDALQAIEIDRGHCGLLPAPAIQAMARAQIARDATIADAMVRARQSSGLPVVLLAGNGHVRLDLGVPRHLRARMPNARIFSIGLLEESEAVHAGRRPQDADKQKLRQQSPRFDWLVMTPPHPRPDPCEAFKAHMRKKPS